MARLITDYTLIRSRRKTLCLRIERDLKVSVRAPLRTAKTEIDRFVEQQRDWIDKHLVRMQAEEERRSTFQYKDGQSVPYRGGSLVLAEGSSVKTAQDGGRLLLPSGCDRKTAVTTFFREQARVMVAGAVNRFAPGMGVVPAGVKITSASTRWGSCSGSNRLCFSWRVACLPDPLLDYIAVHELAHIREHNHSSRFWQIVAGVLPDYPQRRAALRAFQREILF